MLARQHSIFQQGCHGTATATVIEYICIAKALLRNCKQGFNLSSMGLGGLEPPTSRLSGVRSNHLSYRPQHNELLNGK